MWLLVILILPLLAYALYWYFRIPTDYWEKLGIPFISPKPIIGSMSLSANMHEVDMQRYQKYGPFVGTFEGKTPVLLLSDPDLLRNVLVKDFPSFLGRRIFASGDPISDNMISTISGEKWKRIRTIITPAFSTGKIKRMTDVILNSAKVATQNLAENAGTPVNGKEIFGTFTMDVIASTAFATKVDSYQDPNNQFVQNAKLAFQRRMPWRFVLFLLFPSIMKMLGLSLFPPKPIKFFTKITLDIIAERRRTGKVGSDFLQLLMDAEKESQELEKENITEVEKTTDDINAQELAHDEDNDKIFKTTGKFKSLSHDELISQCVIFFLAGYETTAATLAFIAYQLALNPEVQEKLSQEVDEVITKYEGKLTYEGIQEMSYLDRVVAETLRIFPPAVRIERLANEDYTLENTNIKIDKGTVIVAPVYAIHHNPEYYPDPEKFDPERFTPEEKAKRHPYTYLTFGAGPRNCVGMRFALMEIKLCLAYVISQLRIKRCLETQVPLDFFSGAGFLMPKEVLFTVEKRENRVFDGLQE